MLEKQQTCHKQPPINCISQREHFNYLRNNSCGIWNTFNWGTTDATIQNQRINLRDQYEEQQNIEGGGGYGKDTRKQQPSQQNIKGSRRVAFDDANAPRNQQNIPQQRSPNVPKSRNNVPDEQKRRPVSSFQKRSRLQKDQQAQRQKQEQNRQKVVNYIQQIRPYTRGLSNTKFQQYFGKAAPQCYGRANTNQPIGGVIYGNHLKSFNINPHVYTNKPQHYQTHTTAINYGKRAKVCVDKKWKRLEKQLTKKLGLKEVNEKIKEGKQVVYVDVDDKNKYQILRENHEFQKANRDQIHNRELEYKRQKHLEYLDNINQYYAKKQQKIAENLSTRQSIDYTGASLSPEELEAKLNQQVVYKYHDKNGNVRLAADRHGMTCFVDMNFPENEAAYVEQLNNRSPIFPIRVQGQDRYIDAIRKQNCKKGREEVYPSHYLLRNCEEPEVLKMLSNKTGVKIPGSKIQNQGRIASGRNEKRVGVNSPIANKANKSFASTSITQNQQGQKGQQSQGRQGGGNFDRSDYIEGDERNYGQNRNGQLRANKSQIFDRAWKDPKVAGQIVNTMNKTCCLQDHLPHNQMNPQCYKNASTNVGKIPYAG